MSPVCTHSMYPLNVSTLYINSDSVTNLAKVWTRDTSEISNYTYGVYYTLYKLHIKQNHLVPASLTLVVRI